MATNLVKVKVKNIEIVKNAEVGVGVFDFFISAKGFQQLSEIDQKTIQSTVRADTGGVIQIEKVFDLFCEGDSFEIRFSAIEHDEDELFGGGNDYMSFPLYFVIKKQGNYVPYFGIGNYDEALIWFIQASDGANAVKMNFSILNVIPYGGNPTDKFNAPRYGLITFFMHGNGVAPYLNYGEGLTQNRYNQSWVLRGNLSNSVLENDSISSIRLERGCRVIIYEDDNFSGRSLTLENNINNLDTILFNLFDYKLEGDKSWNDTISSFEMYADMLPTPRQPR
jgi:hypothetical protein